MDPMKPMQPMSPMQPMAEAEAWWPEELGRPSTSGGQGGMRYAFFPEKRRLLVQKDGTVTAYDTADHRISGVSQSGKEDGEPTFTAQDGPVALSDLAPAG